MTPAGEVILKLFLRTNLDVADVAHLGAFLGPLDLREMLPAVEVRILRLERIKENVTDAALFTYLPYVAQRTSSSTRASPRYRTRFEARDLVVTRVRVEVGVCVP